MNHDEMEALIQRMARTSFGDLYEMYLVIARTRPSKELDFIFQLAVLGLGVITKAKEERKLDVALAMFKSMRRPQSMN